MFYIFTTLSSNHVQRSKFFNVKSMIGIERIYKLLDCMQQAANKDEIRQRLHTMIYKKSSCVRLIKQVRQSIDELFDPYCWYQLVIWNNFLHGVYGFGDNEWRNKASSISFSLRKQQNKIMASAYKNKFELKISVVSLLSVDYLIEIKLDGRNCPLENEIIEILEKQVQVVNNFLLQMEKQMVRDRALSQAKKDCYGKKQELFDKLCNVLSVFGPTGVGVDVILNNQDKISKVFDSQEISFDAAFDFFSRLKLFPVEPNALSGSGKRTRTKQKKPASDDIDMKSDGKVEKEGKDEKEETDGAEYNRVDNFLLDYFGRSVTAIESKKSIERLHELLVYKEFIFPAKQDLKNQFYTNIGENEHLCYDSRFIAPIKHIIKSFSDDKMKKWYLEYWVRHGIKAVIDIIYQCEFNFGIFCQVITENREKLRDSKICSFEEWLEVIACRNIPNLTKQVLCQNPPKTLKDIYEMDDEEKIRDAEEKLMSCLVMVVDQQDGNKQFEFEKPLMKFEKDYICNPLVEHLVGDSFPDVDAKSSQVEIVSFFSGKIGEKITQLLYKLDNNAKKEYQKQLMYCNGKVRSFHTYWSNIRNMAFGAQNNQDEKPDVKLRCRCFCFVVLFWWLF